MNKDLEEKSELLLDFRKLNKIAESNCEVLPAIIQDCADGEVLMMGYMNRAALEKTRETKVVHFWSTSRNEMWEKGATSENRLTVEDIYVNCEQNSLLIKARKQKGGACHTNDSHGKPRNSCYYRRLKEGNTLDFIR